MTELSPAATTIQAPEPSVITKEDMRISMDRSRPFSEIYGARGPGDPHQNCHYIQDGLFFDAEGMLILDHVDYETQNREGQLKRQALEKKIKRHVAKMQGRRQAVHAEGGPDMPRGIEALDDDEAEADGEDKEVDLSAWITGREQYEWSVLTQVIAHRYKSRVASIADAIPFLVKEGLVTEGQVARKFRKYLD